MTSTHPFLDSEFLIRWSRLGADAVRKDMEVALQDAQKLIDAIGDLPPSQTTFDNTFLALERAGEHLQQPWGKVSHLITVCDSEALREAYNAMLPLVSEFHTRIPLNEKVWAALQAFAGKPGAAKLEGVQKRLFDETMIEFRQHGADLPSEKKKRLEAIESELAGTTRKYSENVLDSTNAWELVLTNEAQLAGLPDTARESALENARRKGFGDDNNPAWRFTLHQPSLEPFLVYLDDDSLRQKMWEGACTIGAVEPRDNTPLIHRILELRGERAALLGKPHFADLVLERRMAGNGKTALDFVEDMRAKVSEAFQRECEELQDFKSGKTGQPAAPLEPWELAYWSEKMRRERFDFDEEQLRPYFAIDCVIDGLFRIAERLFGLRIRNNADSAETWHDEVKVYDVFDADGGQLLGTFYADWHPRESKRSGAWMNYLITGGPQPDGSRLPHLGLICGNLTAPVGNKPALLNHREVETVFHEFGHLLHHLLGEVAVKSLNGVNVAWDFVELPSQIMENWTWERESLDMFARHFQTDAAIPEDLFQRMIAARNFRAATGVMRQLAFCRVDLEMHMNPERFLRADDLEAEIRKLLADYIIPTKTPAPSILRRFGHLFSDSVGYAAGYYSYKWAEVLDADAFTRFQKEGIFNGETGRAFRANILSQGNAEDPMVLYKRFMGREPDPAALLIRSGLIPAGG